MSLNDSIKQNIKECSWTLIESIGVSEEGISLIAKAILQLPKNGRNVIVFGSDEDSALEAKNFFSKITCLSSEGNTIMGFWLRENASFEEELSVLVHSFAKPEDIVIAISRCEKSKNTLLAINSACTIGCHVWHLTGEDNTVKHHINCTVLNVPSTDHLRIKITHAVWLDTIYKCVCEGLV